MPRHHVYLLLQYFREDSSDKAAVSPVKPAATFGKPDRPASTTCQRLTAISWKIVRMRPGRVTWGQLHGPPMPLTAGQDILVVRHLFCGAYRLCRDHRRAGSTGADNEPHAADQEHIESGRSAAATSPDRTSGARPCRWRIRLIRDRAGPRDTSHRSKENLPGKFITSTPMMIVSRP